MPSKSALDFYTTKVTLTYKNLDRGLVFVIGVLGQKIRLDEIDWLQVGGQLLAEHEATLPEGDGVSCNALHVVRREHFFRVFTDGP